MVPGTAVPPGPRGLRQGQPAPAAGSRRAVLPASPEVQHHRNGLPAAGNGVHCQHAHLRHQRRLAATGPRLSGE